ncbi:MAG: formiminoglutamase [Parvicella sp.]|jgi:formiminoglutamase
MDFSIYFKPIQSVDFEDHTLGSLANMHDEFGFPDLEDVKIAIIGVKDSRGCALGGDYNSGIDIIRTELYALFHHQIDIPIADLGNIEQGASLNDTYHAVADVVHGLNKKGIFALILGGSQDLTYANYLAYEKLEQTINLAVIDDTIDFGNDQDEINSNNFLSKIILHQPNYLFNCSSIGYQTYLNSPVSKKLMDDLFFDSYRLGEIQSNIAHGEPALRNADILSIDVSSIRSGEFQGKKIAGPNGFYGEEICQLMRYAGISDKLSSLGIYEYYSENDLDFASAKLIAQMLWCAIDGICSRKKDFPAGTKDNYIRYRIHLENTEHELVFYKSDKSDRWWMDIPYPPNKILKFERHHLVPCNYSDYQKASEGIMPDLWWKTYQKLN